MIDDPKSKGQSFAATGPQDQTKPNPTILPETAATCQAAADALAEYRARVAAADKHLATLRAQFALRGFELHIIANDGRAEFCVSRWGLTRTARSLAELQEFAAQVGAV